MFKTNNFLSFWYYNNACDNNCDICQSQRDKILVRHRVFFGFKKPLIQLKTIYSLVCPDCGKIKVLDGEGKIAPYINQIKGQVPSKHMETDQEPEMIDYIKMHLNIN